MGHHLPRRRALNGVSLLETVVAIFLLAAQILLISGMAQQFSRNQRLARQRTRAAGIGQRKLDEIRQWARQPANFASDWSAYNNQVTEEEPGFRVTVACNGAGQPIYTPCLPLEAQYGPRARRMARSVVPVRVTVSWDPSSSNSQLELNSLVGAPVVPGPYTLSMQPDPAFATPVLDNQPFGFRVTVRDGNGREINDLQFQWRVKPRDGNASLIESPTRSMQTGQARHRFVRYGVPVQVDGFVELECRLQYHGQLLQQLTGPVELR